MPLSFRASTERTTRCLHRRTFFAVCPPNLCGERTEHKWRFRTRLFRIYYSIANANAYATSQSGMTCHIELVIVGALPDARYFSVTDNDMH